MAESIHAYAEKTLGTADSEAGARALLRTRLSTALTLARDAGGVVALIASEIAPGTPMPVMITIYSPRELRMTPAIGTSTQAVSTILKRGLTELGIEGIDGATELAIEGSAILRIVREQDVELHPDVPEQKMGSLIADYWYTVPGSKQVVLANFMTPLADIPTVMLSFFDAAVLASYFVEAKA